MRRLDAVPTVSLTRVVKFSAAHRYFRPEWPEERNADVFGACAREHGHGHSYTCRITVAGEPDGDTSMVMDLRELDAILEQEVRDRFDHRHLNLDVAEFAYGRTVPTAEALVLDIWHRVRARLPQHVTLECVRVQEEPELFAEYRGDE